VRTRASQSYISRRIEMSALWVLDGADSSSVHSYGNEFAKTINVIAHQPDPVPGSSSSLGKAPRTTYSYPAFRKSIFEEPLIFPALRNGHIAMGHEYQHKEQERFWSRAGKKISEEPRFPKSYENMHPGGFERVKYIPKFSEKPIQYFAHERVKSPFKKAQKFTRPKDLCNYDVKPVKADEFVQGKYKVHDPWLDSMKKTCGVVRPTGQFATRYFDDPQRPSTATEGNFSMRPLMPEYGSDPHFSSGIPSKGYSQQQKSASAASLIAKQQHNRSRPGTTGGSRSPTGKKIVIPAASRAPKGRRAPGFKFLQGKNMLGALDVVTGSTGSDLVYTRVKTTEGHREKSLIVPVNKGEIATEIGGSGYALSATWNRTGSAAESDPELKVKTELATIQLKRKHAHPESAIDVVDKLVSLDDDVQTTSSLSRIGCANSTGMESPVVPKRTSKEWLRTPPSSPSRSPGTDQRLMTPEQRLRASMPFKLAENFVPRADTDSRSIDPLTGRRLPPSFVINESADEYGVDFDALFAKTI